MENLKKLLATIEKFPPNLEKIIGKTGLFLRKEGEFWIGETKAQYQAQNFWHTTKAKSLEELITEISKKIDEDTIENFYGK